ncbi:MAG: hypothetical protein JZU52_19590 [Lamprocystis purpurea]|jgi:hypothetical protein|nr:hypothetical protein [Lamprocystis purpurea]MBV5275741.1 hypothetical protein [Lamprocystis purpurea]
MNTIERITITLTAEMAQAVRGAVQAGALIKIPATWARRVRSQAILA